MSESSSPIAPLRMSLPNSPNVNNPISNSNPQNPTLLSPQVFTAPNSPSLHPSPGFVSGGNSFLGNAPEPLSPMPEGWRPRPIPHMNQDDVNVSRVMEALGIANPTTDQAVTTLVDRVVLLETKSRRDANTIRELKILLPDLRSLKMDLLSIRSGSQQDIQQVRGNIDAVNSSTGYRLDHIEELARNPVTPRVFREPPYQEHVYFSGTLAETRAFCFAVRGILERNSENFKDEKHKIMWIAGMFRKHDGKMGDDCASYGWWVGLMESNASQQGLDPKTASSRPDFILPVLQSAEIFLVELESHFSVTVEVEEARRVLRSLRQGNSSIQEFNNTFNSHLYSVGDLDDMSKCEIYMKAIKNQIFDLGVWRGCWKDVKTLVQKQEMAVTLSSDPGLHIVDCVMTGKSAHQQQSQGSRTVTQTRVDQRIIHPPPKFGKPSNRPEPVPMDLDTLEADAEFTLDAWREECISLNMCWRCGGDFDLAHSENRGCCIPRVHQLDRIQRLEIWKDWGGNVSSAAPPPPRHQPRGSGSAPPSSWARDNRSSPRHSGTPRYSSFAPAPPVGSNVGRNDKGKKRESVSASAFTEDPASKRRTDTSGPPASGEENQFLANDAMDTTQESLGDICFERGLSNMMYED
ncbi:hypothetical protein Pst134EB_033351 [Puccinia striiformis f. sp. tritici]|nr:hypothetical protein Pst134EB_033351 [Puccinia striiformis f. sp. tritici]